MRADSHHPQQGLPLGKYLDIRSGASPGMARDDPVQTGRKRHPQDLGI
jgi:hypothetical protein